MKPLDKGPFEDVMKIDGPCAHFIGKDNSGVEVDDGFSFKMIVGGICPDGAGVKVEIQHEDALCPAEQLYVNCLDLGVDTLEDVEVILRGLDNNPFKQLKSLMQEMGPIIRQFGVWQSGLEMVCHGPLHNHCPVLRQPISTMTMRLSISMVGSITYEHSSSVQSHFSTNSSTFMMREAICAN